MLNNIDLTIDIKACATLLGRTGCGKSALINLMVVVLNPLNVKSTFDTRAKMDYLSQHHLEQLDSDSTPLKTMVDCWVVPAPDDKIYIVATNITC